NAPPQNAAVSLAFTDTDSTAGFINGSLLISKASDESDVTHYEIYWGQDDSTKLDGEDAIGALEATGDDLSYNFGESTEIPANATHFLVFTRNTFGEMATGTSLLIIDKGVPEETASSIAFTDSDSRGG